MRIVDTPKERGMTPEEQQEARRAWHRQRLIAKIVNSDRVELPLGELEFRPRGIIEHVASPDGNWYRVVGGDPDYMPGVNWYYVTADGDPVPLERASGTVASRREYAEYQAAREARRNAPRKRSAR